MRATLYGSLQKDCNFQKMQFLFFRLWSMHSPHTAAKHGLSAVTFRTFIDLFSPEKPALSVPFTVRHLVLKKSFVINLPACQTSSPSFVRSTGVTSEICDSKAGLAAVTLLDKNTKWNKNSACSGCADHTNSLKDAIWHRAAESEDAAVSQQHGMWRLDLQPVVTESSRKTRIGSIRLLQNHSVRNWIVIDSLMNYFQGLIVG